MDCTLIQGALIGYHFATLSDDDGIEIELGEALAAGRRELCDSHRDVDQSFGVRPGTSPRASEQRRSPQRCHHLLDVASVHRKRANRHVAQDLREDASCPDEQDLAEHRIARKPDDHLDATRQLLLDLDALHAGGRHESLGAFGELAVDRSNLSR